MAALSNAQLLDVWELGRSQSPAQRSISLASWVAPEMALSEVAALPLREVDARLLGLRESLFGSSVPVVVACPRCGTELEACFDAAQVLPAAAASALAADTALETTAGECRVRYRLASAGDLVALEGIADATVARQRLLELCVFEAWRAGEQVSTRVLPEQDQDALIEAIAGEYAADTEITLSCVECRESSRFVFDVGAFLWTELDAWAHRLVNEVHLLAREYGWSELAILSMSASRRETYLSMVSR